MKRRNLVDGLSLRPVNNRVRIVYNEYTSICEFQSRFYRFFVEHGMLGRVKLNREGKIREVK